MDVLGGNILNPEIGSITDMNIRAGTKLTIRTKDDVPSNGGNVLFKTADNENVWLGIDAGINKRQIVLLKDVVKFENRLVSGIEHALYIGDGKDYEPYHALQNIAMLAPNSIPGIPVSSGGNYTDETGQQWIADYRDWEHGVDVQMVFKAIFDGTEEIWRLPSSNNNNAVFTNLLHTSIVDYSDTYNFMCNLFTNPIHPAGGYADALNKGVGMYYHISDGYRYLYFVVPLIIAQNIAEWKDYLNNNKLEILYEANTSVETPIPADELAAYQALHTNTPTTTITNDEDCWMEVGYTADTKAHIEQNYVPKESYMALEKRVAALETQAIENI